MSNTINRLEQSDSKRRFTNRVADYVAGRPSYPQAVIGVLESRVGFTSAWAIADIGAGTGISSRLFLENGNPVVAIEPNDAMRSAAAEWLGSFAGFRTLSAPAEATTLPDHSVDLIVAAQAFHWFDRQAFARECDRLLTPRGRVLVMWNDRDVSDPFTAGYEAIVVKYASDYEKVGHRKRDNQELTNSWFEPATRLLVEVPNPQGLDLATAKARIASSSYMPARDSADYGPMMSELESLFEQHEQDGQVAMPHLTRMNIGRPVTEKR